MNRTLEQCLRDFARGVLSRHALEECLNGKVEFHFWDINERSSKLLARLPKVRFSRADVDAQLRRFLAKELTARELSDWAGAMRLLGCFVLDEEEPGSSEVWDIMDEIMSPDVWGPLNVESAIELQGRLHAKS